MEGEGETTTAVNNPEASPAATADAGAEDAGAADAGAADAGAEAKVKDDKDQERINVRTRPQRLGGEWGGWGG